MTVSGASRGISHQPPPVFNKRLFKAQAGIVLTEEILQILGGSLPNQRSVNDLYKLKSVVVGLKDIHKGLQFIKDALGYVITYEKIESGKTVTKKRSEKELSCYYILSGSVEAKYLIYDDKKENPAAEGVAERQMPESIGECEIGYTHVAGDYLGLVSGDGPQYDLPPPESMRAIEVCEFLRVDRGDFHKAVRMVQNRHVQEIEHFINHSDILRHLPAEERANLVPLMAKQEYAAGKVIINQGDVPEHIFFVGKGRCQYFRRVYIGEARRLELVRLGQAEEGGFFGETTLLSGSPCFCSVTSIGPVTCYLVNIWAIKTNEHILNLLREHQRYFHEDEMIKHFIRDSDVWQSYKRDKIVELMEGTDRQHVVIAKDKVPDVLSTAVDFGDAKRRQSSQSTHEKEPGEPKTEEPLFVTPRSRRRSSAILHSNAAAVVKAVLLLRRNADSVEARVPLPRLPHAPTPVTLPSVRSTDKPQRCGEKPSSAPGRYRMAPKPNGDDSTSPIWYRSKTVAGSRAETPSSPVFERSGNRSAPRGSSKSTSDPRKQTKTVTGVYSRAETPSSPGFDLSGNRSAPRGSSKSTGDPRKQTKTVTGVHSRAETPSSPGFDLSGNRVSPRGSSRSASDPRKQTKNSKRTDMKKKTKGKDAPATKPQSEPERPLTIATEKIVASNRNFIVKEVINTGIPGKRIPSPVFRRFENSMFGALDDPKPEPEQHQFGPSPWSISFAANRWMSSVRKKRAQLRSPGNRSTSSPPLPPIIVIAEYTPAMSAEEAEGGSQDTADRAERAMDTVRCSSAGRCISRTPSPALEELREEDEDEILEYERHEAGKAVQEEWYTAIHLARDQSKCHLQRVRKELEGIRKVRNIMRRHLNSTGEEKVAAEEQDTRAQDQETAEHEEEGTKESQSGSSSATKQSLSRHHSYRCFSSSQRSRTFSSGHVSETDLTTRRRSMGPSHVLRSEFLSRLHSGSSGVATKQSSTLLYTNQTRKTDGLTRNEKRRLLLLGKLGLR